MSNTSLFFATNRGHQGSDRWKPKNYGKTFSKDGMQNLRFGELTLTVDDGEVKEYLSKGKKERKGDGEGLAGYLSNLVEKASINAYKDMTSTLKKVTLDIKSSLASGGSTEQLQTLQAKLAHSISRVQLPEH